MDNQVEEVKSKVDIVSVIGERIELKKAGRNFKASCPFHGEKTASFMVSPELQIFKCFGCAEGGDVFSFLEKYEGMDFSEALKYLADKVGVKIKSFKGSDMGEKEKIIEINFQALKFYNYLLLNHKVGQRALNYLLKERGLKKSTIEEFQLGYSPENSLVIKKFLVDKKKFLPKDLETAGLMVFRGSNAYDRFNGRVIFPLFDHRGNPIGFSGRVLPWVNTEMGKYINSPETPIYHKSSVLYGLNLTRPFIKKKGVAIIVEGELDAISSYQSGIKNVVAIKGSALTEEQVRLLSRFSQKFILALDADLAGDAASRRGITIASNAGVEVKVAEIEEGKDPDEAARKNLEGYKKSLIKAVSIWDFFIDSAIKRNDSKTGVGKSKISREIMPVLGEIEDNIVQAHYIGVVAKRLGIPEEAVTEQILKFTKDPKGSDSSVVEEVKNKDRKTLLEERFLALTFLSDPKILLEKDIAEFISAPLGKRILEEYQKFMAKSKDFDFAKFAKGLPPELFAGFSQMTMMDNSEFTQDDEQIKKELDLVKKELKILSVREKLKSLASKIKDLEEKGEKNELFIAQEKFNKLASLLSKFEHTEDSSIIFSD
ncbi:MAG: DNA primase [Microgenomates group bacterium]